MKYPSKYISSLIFLVAGSCLWITAPRAFAETWFVNVLNGDDRNQGTEEKPLKTLHQAAIRAMMLYYRHPNSAEEVLTWRATRDSR